MRRGGSRRARPPGDSEFVQREQGVRVFASTPFSDQEFQEVGAGPLSSRQGSREAHVMELREEQQQAHRNIERRPFDEAADDWIGVHVKGLIRSDIFDRFIEEIEFAHCQLIVLSANRAGEVDARALRSEREHLGVLIIHRVGVNRWRGDHNFRHSTECLRKPAQIEEMMSSCGPIEEQQSYASPS